MHLPFPSQTLCRGAGVVTASPPGGTNASSLRDPPDGCVADRTSRPSRAAVSGAVQARRVHPLARRVLARGAVRNWRTRRASAFRRLPPTAGGDRRTRCLAVSTSGGGGAHRTEVDKGWRGSGSRPVRSADFARTDGGRAAVGSGSRRSARLESCSRRASYYRAPHNFRVCTTCASACSPPGTTRDSLGATRREARSRSRPCVRSASRPRAGSAIIFGLA